MKKCNSEKNNTDAKKCLDNLRDEVHKCCLCPLCEGRTHAVFGVGLQCAKVMIIGEAPGKNEDAAGVPFVGAAGKNLDELLCVAGLERDKVYITNVVKCKPPSNRNPHVAEIQACAPYLRKQVSIINPEIIVSLGNFATKFILRTECGITNLRGRVHMAGKFSVYPVFHPAAALYDIKKKDVMLRDFEQLGYILQRLENDKR